MPKVCRLPKEEVKSNKIQSQPVIGIVNRCVLGNDE
jgi:hypothetical protein